MVFDTLQPKKDLERDFTSAQAEVLARAPQQHVVEDIAARRDLEVGGGELRAEMRSLWIVGALPINVFSVAGPMVTLIETIH